MRLGAEGYLRNVLLEIQRARDISLNYEALGLGEDSRKARALTNLRALEGCRTYR